MALLKQFMSAKATNPYASTQNHKNPTSTCYPSDSNIGFEKGTLSGWNAYYAINNSSSSFNLSAPVGGTCGNVTGAANDPTTNMGTAGTTDYQVSIMTGGTDPLATVIPRVSPTGGNYSVRVGDSTNPDQGVAILNQEFTVTAANAQFQYQYAVLLENPIGHTYSEQPFFSVLFLDQNGDTIKSAYQFIVASSANKAGFDSVFYAGNNDYAYYKNWTSNTVSLASYIGQCVTVQFEVGDCSLGGHFGYAYIDASVAPLGINEVQDNSSFSVYPVPATNKLNVTIANYSFTPKQATVYDITGRAVFTENVNMQKNAITLDVSRLDNGVYTLMLTDGNTKRQTKFIIAK
jgi:hypothetical protein